MPVLFGREYQLIIGRPQQLAQFIIPQSIAAPRLIDEGPPQTTSNGDVIDWNSIPPEWYEITDEEGSGLSLTAEINQTKDSSAPCKIEIKNALESNVNRLRKDDLVILRGGYNQAGGNFIQAQGVGVGREQWPDLFVGQVVEVNTDWKAQDRITTILCGEGVTVRKNSKLSFSWPPGTFRVTVLNDLINMLKTQGIPLGRLVLPQSGTQELEKLNREFLTGFTVKGYLLDEFEKYCDSVGMRAYTAVGKMYVEPKVSTPVFAGIPQASPVAAELPASVEIFQITPDQVKGRVQPMSDNVGQNSNAGGDRDKQGVKLSVWLDGQVTISKFINLKGFEQDYDGDYEITSVQHKLDFRSNGMWDTIITAKR